MLQILNAWNTPNSLTTEIIAFYKRTQDINKQELINTHAKMKTISDLSSSKLLKLEERITELEKSLNHLSTSAKEDNYE